MKYGSWILLSLMISYGGAGATEESDSLTGFVHVRSADISYEADQDIPGLGYALLSGDPDRQGVYVMRLKIPPGHTFPPHFHDQDRHVTVISGTWAFGTGYSGRCEETMPLEAGAYVMHPRGAVHFDGACGDESVEVQIIGQGPVKTTTIEASGHPDRAADHVSRPGFDAPFRHGSESDPSRIRVGISGYP